MKEDPNRRNVFRLSGNMALGTPSTTQLSNSNSKQTAVYSKEQVNNAKNSLRLLKSKQTKEEEYAQKNYNQKQVAYEIPNYQNNYSNQRKEIQSSNSIDKNKQTNIQKNPINYQDNQTTSKNNIKNDWQSKIQTNSKPNIPNIPRNRPSQTQTSQNQSSQNQFYQTKQKPISQLKKEQKLEIKEYKDSDLILCSEGCGRKFNPQSISKHQNVCKKVFQQKRKQFNTQAQRIENEQQLKLMKKGAVIDKKLQEMKKKNEKKMPKWKAQSTAFRAMIQQNRNGPMNAQEQKQYKKAQQALKQASGYVKCPTCGRSFAQKAGQRHIPFCAQQAKKNQFKNKKK